MSPDLFHVDYSRLLEVLITIVFFSFVIERALSILFESRPFIKRVDGIEFKEIIDSETNEIKTIHKSTGKTIGGFRELLSFIVSVIVCYCWSFDALTIVLQTSDKMTLGGIILTGAIVAGGSKASIALFKDLLGFMSSAEKYRKGIKK